MTQGAQPARTTGTPNWIRIGAIVVLAIVVGVIVWLIVKDDNKKDKSSPGPPPASAATIGTLRSLSGQLGHPVYWAGSRRSFTYELTQVNGNVFIRYLPTGVNVGDTRPDFLTVGSYPG